MAKVIGSKTHKRQLIWTVEDNGTVGYSVEFSNGKVLPSMEKAKKLADYQKRVNLTGFTQ